MIQNDKLYMIVPAYNEESNIEQLITEWYPVIEKTSSESRMVIIDDGSKDSTYEKLKRLSKNRPQLIPITKENGGHGDTLLHGYNYAIENGADYIFQTDSDGQTNPNEFEQFWLLRKEYDGIFGNRIKREDGKSRVIVEKTLCRIIKIIFKVKVPDANAPFRLMKTEKVKEYIELMPEHYNLPNVILTTVFKYYNDKVVFIPITFKTRQGGKNSINIKKIIKIGWKALNDFKLIRKRMKKYERSN